MKSCKILIAFALLACVTHALDVTSLFSADASRISDTDLAEICNSEGKKASLNRFLFREGDINGDGYLSLIELKFIYSRLTQVLAIKAAPDSTVSSRFNMADHKTKDNRLSYSEFIWLMGSDLIYSNNNYAVATGAVNTLNNLVNSLTNIWTQSPFKSQYNLYTGTLDKKNVSYEKFKAIVNTFLPQATRLKTGWNDCVLQGYFKHCDADSNSIVTLDEINSVLPVLLNDLQALLACSKK